MRRQNLIGSVVAAVLVAGWLVKTFAVIGCQYWPYCWPFGLVIR